MSKSEHRWPSTNVDYGALEPLPVPWLKEKPHLINIDIGRQLFVDDYLIEKTNLSRRFYAAETHGASPLLQPETEIEMNRGQCPVAAPFNDGLWWDPETQQFMMWYHAGWFDGTALALSKDGIHWERPELDVVPGTNLVLKPRESYMRDGCTVWLDHEASREERFKLFIFFRHAEGMCAESYFSVDGIHWGDPIRHVKVDWREDQPPCDGLVSDRMGDNTGFFFDPFRKRWVFSMRDKGPLRIRGRSCDEDFLTAASFQNPMCWCRLDKNDEEDPQRKMQPELYDLQATAYESLMLGSFGILYGPQNNECEKTGDLKTIDLQLGFSRDGFHYHRPHREAFLKASRQTGTWDNGYLHSVGGICTVSPEKIYFYYTGFSGDSPNLKAGEQGDYYPAFAMYAGASCGLATLRRDGFASLNAGAAGGELTTKLLDFSGAHLFVNAQSHDGKIRAEILDEGGKVISGFSREDCTVFSGDSCAQELRFSKDLSVLAGKAVRIVFALENAQLYSFWVADSPEGKSRGYLAAGGPAYQSQRDI